MTSEADKRYPGEVEETYPDLYTTIPAWQPPHGKPGQLSQDQLKEFFEEGFLIVDKFFEADELEPVKDDINILVDNLATKLHEAGKISKLYKEYGLFKRLIHIDREYPGAAVVLHKLGSLTPAFRALWSNERLLNIMEQLLGTDDIQGHPVWNLRCKVPKSDGHTVPWHQDSAYLDSSTYSALCVTAWIPMLDTNDVNGCMRMIRGGHRKGKVARHTCCWRDTHYIMLDEQEMEKSLGIDLEKDFVTVPVPYGGMVLFSNMIPHQSLNNFSEDVRWSLDLRWQRADKPVGFYGLKEGIQMRSSTDKDFKISWEPFDAVNRHDKQAGRELDPFDTTIPGPWMKQWPMVHTNKHTDALAAADQSGDSPFTNWHPGTAAH